MARYPAPPADPKYDQHFAAIGRVVDTWAQLEFAIDQAIWSLMHTHQMFIACVTAQLIGTGARHRALAALIKLHGSSEKQLGEINKFFSERYHLQIKRNRCAHDPRMIFSGSGKLERLEITADKSLTFDFQPETVESLEKIRAEIADAIEQFATMFNRIAAELNALPDKARPPLNQILPAKQAVVIPTTEPSVPQPPPKPSAE